MASEFPPSPAAQNSQALLKQAVALHQVGQWLQAEQLYDRILQREPDHALANHNRGALDVQRQQPELGLPYFIAALNADPAKAQYWLSYVDALIQANRRDEAAEVLALAQQNGLEGEEVETLKTRLTESPENNAAAAPTQSDIDALGRLFNNGQLQQALDKARAMATQYPRHGFAWKVLGLILRAKGEMQAATKAMQQAVALSPDDAEAQCNLGIVLHDLRQLPDAENAYRLAIQVHPDYAEAYSNLGTLLYDQCRWPEAEQCLHSAVQLNPGLADAHYNLGNTLQAAGRSSEAIASYREAVRLRPGWVAAQCNLGVALLKLGKAAEAESVLRVALAKEPQNLLVLNNLGNALKEQGRLTDAEGCYRHVLSLKPELAEVHNNLGSLLQDMGQLQQAAASYRAALRLKPDYLVAHSNLLFMLNYDPQVEAPAAFAEARRYAQQVAAMATSPHSSWNCDRSAQRLRIGLVSGDLRNHPVGYFLEGVLNHLDAEKVEIHIYPTDSWVDELTLRLRSRCPLWKSLVGLTDQAAAKLIHDDAVHILIDLSGHSRYNRLAMFAWKPAPLQVSWLGYFATTGVAAIDYLVADSATLPPAQEQYFTEKIVRLPETRLCFTRPDVAVDVSALPALANGHVTFGCFNNLAKMNDQVVALWARMLNAIPGSHLLLKCRQLADESLNQSTKARFAAHGIAEDRLILEAAVARADYFAGFHRVDIAVDPFPYPGGTTTVESLWMGVPVLTLGGDSFLSRQGQGLLENAGLPEWVATSEDDYLAKAVTFAGDLTSLAAMRARLRQQVEQSPVMDGSRFATNLVNVLKQMWTSCNTE